MRKIILCTLLLISLVRVSAQTKADTVQFLLNRLDIIGDSLKKQNQLILSIQKKIDDGDLSRSIQTAEGIITKQGHYISIFEVVFGVIAVLIVVVTFFTFFYNIQPLIKRADQAVIRAETTTTNVNTRFDNFNAYVENTLNSKFTEFANKIKEERLDQIFSDLFSNLPFQKKLALEFISTIPIETITISRIYSLIEFLSQPQSTEEEKIPVVELLTQIDKPEVKSFFISWSNVKPHNNTLKMFLFNYYINKGFSNYLIPVSNFIINYSPQSEEFKNYCGLLSSLNPRGITELINYPQLASGLNGSRKQEICNYLQANKIIWRLENEIDNCLLCKSISSI